MTIKLGVVDYCSYVGEIWSGIKSCFTDSNVDLDCRLFNTYEDLDSALVNKSVDIAWMGNLAHVRLQRRIPNIISLGMRDTDQDFKSVLVGKSNFPLKSTFSASINHTNIAAGTVDSAQTYILPFFFLQRMGVRLETLNVTRFDRDMGKHGDTAIGEELALQELMDNHIDLCVVSDLMYQRGLQSGKVSGTRVIHTFPAFDHCVFDALPDLNVAKQQSFVSALFAMKFENPKHQAIMKLEGIRHEWRLPRSELYRDLSDADASFAPKFHSLLVK